MYKVGISFLFFMLIIIRSNYERKTIRTSQYTISNENISKQLSGFRICFITDLHNHQFGNNNELLVKTIDKNKPDLILIGGDLLVGRPGASYQPALQLLRDLTKRYKVYYCNGNHESRMKYHTEIYGDAYQTYVGQAKALGVVFLNNEMIVFDDYKFCIKGLEIPLDYYKRGKSIELSQEVLTDCLGSPHKDYFQLLMAHHPNYFREYCQWGADLVLSGHVHGGIVRLPVLGGVISTQFAFFPKFDSGMFSQGSSKMILSRGLGTHTIQFRLFNYPELCLITLKEKEKTYES